MKTIGLKNKNSGFTLIESIIVVVILGILAAIALPKLTENIDKAKAAEAFGVGATIAKSLDRCLANESAGLAPTAAHYSVCLPGAATSAGLVSDIAALGMQAMQTTNFTYSKTTAAGVGTPLVVTATLVGSVPANTDIITFDVNGTTGAVTKACAGRLSKMCK